MSRRECFAIRTAIIGAFTTATGIDPQQLQIVVIGIDKQLGNVNSRRCLEVDVDRSVKVECAGFRVSTVSAITTQYR